LPSIPKGEIVGRFTVGSELFIDGEKNDGKDQHNQQCNDNGRGGETVNVGSHSKSLMTIRSAFREE
jgi:hypothetical protein